MRSPRICRRWNAKGALLREPNKARGLVLADSYRGRAMIEIPIYGTIPAGLPADERQEPDGCISVDVETLRLPKGARVFALKVRGESMIGAGILSGDVVVLEFREPRNGEVVAALIDGETTLKRYVVQRGKPFLKAENPRFQNLIPAQELVIQGVQVGLLRILNPDRHEQTALFRSSRLPLVRPCPRARSSEQLELPLRFTRRRR